MHGSVLPTEKKNILYLQKRKCDNGSPNCFLGWEGLLYEKKFSRSFEHRKMIVEFIKICNVLAKLDKAKAEMALSLSEAHVSMGRSENKGLAIQG